MPAFLQPDIQQVASQAISFLLLLWFLRRFAWKPLLTVLDQRRARIEEELRQVAQSRAELVRLQEDYGRRLAAIEHEARTKIQQAIIEGKRISSEIQEQARQQGYEILTKSKEAVEMELAKARVTLRDQVAQMTVEAVERILRVKLDAKADRHLVDEMLDELERNQPRA
ncbi:MAG: F0F1 ATP synthase subunit B [bacterium]